MPKYTFNPFVENDDRFPYKIIVDHEKAASATAISCDTDEGWVEFLNILEKEGDPKSLKSEYFDFDVIEKKSGAVVASHRVTKETRDRLYREFVKKLEAKLGEHWSFHA